ncbi:uncharacterized protein LOC107818395 isoform X1 [Nicotiana tabacum]|uniref:Glycine-rich cell wall structural protein isoform X1 n=1 Tax=Nicotiana tabacum TaxID=4097 RepID=A0A1S4CFG3_TOBAC|nr:glycine-rich cell wall structural protein-like isoform X1 [Nicotiana tomentosiformis]XP_016499883.1 PREDICTED: glycine-rich cell wall structural protein-like isoform X1 [Nicotiana tabacum]
MGSKAFMLIVLAILLVITSEVAARELAESTPTTTDNAKVSEKKNDDVNYSKFLGAGFPGVGGGGFGGYPVGRYGGYPGGGYGGYPGGGYGGYGGYPGGRGYYGGYPRGGYGGYGGYGGGYGGYPRGGWYGVWPRD